MADVIKGRCMKCKAEREMKEANKVPFGKTFAMKGKCAVCGTGMFRILPKNG